MPYNYYNQMINEATVFPKQIKLDDYEQQLEGNLLTIL